MPTACAEVGVSARSVYLDMLTSGEPQDGSYLEVRSKLPSGGMRQEFVPSRAHGAASALIEGRGQETDTYVGVAPRTRREGTRDAVERVHVLWADVDTPEAVAALERFEPKPSMVIASGGPDCHHAYWGVCPPVGPDEAEDANRRLVEALGADRQAVDASRILRPPDTFSFKRGKPVTLEQLNIETYSLEQVVGHLSDPPPYRPGSKGTLRSPVAPERALGDDPLLAIPPVAYVEALTGQVVGRGHKVVCPFHDDKTPSLHVYERPKTPGGVPGWKCYGCGRAGSIIDFGAELYGIEPRGAGYFAIRERLEAHLLGALAA